MFAFCTKGRVFILALSWDLVSHDDDDNDNNDNILIIMSERGERSDWDLSLQHLTFILVSIFRSFVYFIFSVFAYWSEIVCYPYLVLTTHNQFILLGVMM